MDAALPSAAGGSSPAYVADFDYDLPPELIAQVPTPVRDGARLLVVNRSDGELRHETVADLARMLRRGDLLVYNDTRVQAARLFGRTPSGGAVEVLLMSDAGSGRWSCLGRPAKRLRAGTTLSLPSGVTALVEERRGNGRYLLAFPTSVDVAALMERCGEIPLPPYIRRPDGPLPVDGERYQTIFATRIGAVAAPTAGLHFTPRLLQSLRDAHVESAPVTLHVGPGTFLPVRSRDVHAHRMESERAVLPEATVRAVRRAKSEGRRIVAVGTTTTRALESAAARPNGLSAGEFEAAAFILPGFKFRLVDALFTNFHLPKSTLLMLVTAFAGPSLVRHAYAVAVRERYRFYSYGDAMLIQ